MGNAEVEKVAPNLLTHLQHTRTNAAAHWGHSFPMGNTLISMQPCWPSSCDLFPSILALQIRPSVCVSARGGCAAAPLPDTAFKRLIECVCSRAGMLVMFHGG